MAIAEAPARKSAQGLESIEVPLRYRGRRVRFEYEPPEDPGERMRDGNGAEMRACQVDIAKDGSATIRYEDGERGVIRVEWV